MGYSKWPLVVLELRFPKIPLPFPSPTTSHPQNLTQILESLIFHCFQCWTISRIFSEVLKPLRGTWRYRVASAAPWVDGSPLHWCRSRPSSAWRVTKRGWPSGHGIYDLQKWWNKMFEHDDMEDGEHWWRIMKNTEELFKRIQQVDWSWRSAKKYLELRGKHLFCFDMFWANSIDGDRWR